MLVYNLNELAYRRQTGLQFCLLQLWTLVNLQPATRKQTQRVQGLATRMDVQPWSEAQMLKVTAPMTDASSLGFCN